MQEIMVLKSRWQKAIVNECIKIEKHRGGLVFRRVADGKAIMSIKGAGPEKTFITPPFTGIFASKGDPLLTVGSV